MNSLSCGHEKAAFGGEGSGGVNTVRSEANRGVRADLPATEDHT